MPSHNFSHEPENVKQIFTNNRVIRTKIPVPESLPLLEEMYRFEAQAMHGQYPMVWSKAENYSVEDLWGNKWIDFTSTIFVANAGHSNTRIINAIKRLLNKPLLHTYTYASEERVSYLKYLISNTPANFQKAFLLSAGTEATEAALKLMRIHGSKESLGKKGVICFDGAYHGRTVGAQTMTGNINAKKWIGSHDPNIYHMKFPYPWTVDDPKKFFYDEMQRLIDEYQISISEDICGFMIESFQGWGAIFYPKEFIQELKKFADKNKILIAFDEMQAGFGRTGTLFGYEHYEITPDILCCGKGASSGVPLSIVLGSTEIMDGPDIGSMSSTHSANPLVCVAGEENLRSLLEDGLIKNSKKLGEIFHKELKNIQAKFPNHIRYVFGKGLLASLIFIDKDDNPLIELCDKVCEKSFKNGLLVVHTGRESIKLAPPLSINYDALIEGLEVLSSSIEATLLELYG